MINSLPPLVVAAQQRAVDAGFTLACEPGVGRLLATLAAAVPAHGRILEMGTGVGVGTAWIVHGLSGRSDVEVISVELDPTIAAVAQRETWPPWVSLRTGNILDLLAGLAHLSDGSYQHVGTPFATAGCSDPTRPPDPSSGALRRVEASGVRAGSGRVEPPAGGRAALGSFDLIFADAQGGKWDGLDRTIAAVHPGGFLLVDDMTPATWLNDAHRRHTLQVRQTLLTHADLVAAELAEASGMILAVRRTGQGDK